MLRKQLTALKPFVVMSAGARENKLIRKAGDFLRFAIVS